MSTPLATAFVAIRADTSGFKADLAKAGAGAGEGAGKTAGSKFGASLRSGLGTLGNILPATLFLPFEESLGAVETGLDHVEKHGRSVGGVLTGIGIAAAAAGAIATAASAHDQQAQAQLRAAVIASGSSWTEYKDQVEGAIGSQAHYGHSAADVQDALRIVTQATNNPTTALKDLGLEANLAAAQHESLSEAASQVAKILGGSGQRTLRQYGITMASAKAASSALSAAMSAHQGAVDKLSKAQKKLTDIEEVDHGRKKLSISQEIALRNAHDDVRVAQEKVAATSKKVTQAEAANRKAANATSDALTQLSGKLNGQAAAAANTFSGRLKGIGTSIENEFAKISGTVAPALTTLGPVIAGIGLLVQSGVVGALGKGGVAAGKFALDMASAGAKALVSAGRVVASMAVETASVVGAWIAQAAAATASAVAIAAAWLIAYGPIILIGVAIVALVVLVVKNWGSIVAATKAAFHAVVSAVETAVSFVVNFVKAHWLLLVTLIGGPLVLIVVEVIRHFAQIKAVVSAAIADVIRGFARLAAIPGQVASYFAGIVVAVAKKVATLIVYVAGIPGRIVSALGNIDTLLVHAGENLILGFIKGITSKIGGVKSTLGNLTSKLTSWKGPESTDRVILHGNGQLVIDGFIKGLESRYGAVQSSLANLTAGLPSIPVLATAGAPSGGAGARGPVAGVQRSGPLLHADTIQVIGGNPDEVANKLDWELRKRGM